jgi:D-alanyl-D-alanine carboxypeptidase
MIRFLSALLNFGVLILITTACTPVEDVPTGQQDLKELPDAEELQDALDLALRDGQGDNDLGISAAVIVPGYEPWVGVSGNSHPGVPLTSDMLFNVGSVAKSFEAALALDLAEQGLIDLDHPLSTWLPEYPNVDNRITVRQLLNHSSGVFNVFEHPDFPWVDPQVDYDKEWQTEDVIESFVGEPYGPPGYAQHYSSTNYLLLTKIIEQTVGETVPDQVDRLIFEPLVLDNSFMSMGDLPPAHFPVAHPWVDVNLDGELEDLNGIPQTWIASMTHPVLYTTPQDMAKWMHALYHEERVLKDDLLREMLTIPETTLPDPEGGRYGLGVVDFSEILGANVIGHGGSSLGYSAAALYLPEYGISLAWAINTGESPQPLANKLMGNTWTSLFEFLFENQDLDPSS